ncbi:uncharacterized protein LOC121760141 isoform X2 [Salvia splendens]|uniref:uncharacterized protein LOC121760141 isoform X2 n=1 Tax=Salvia splendens TaxID=180675 RepID=UPI001C271E94|nr:uncharacterized protein LOC121760141 isoform X2 [Salvia splendens]
MNGRLWNFSKVTSLLLLTAMKQIRWRCASQTQFTRLKTLSNLTLWIKLFLPPLKIKGIRLESSIAFEAQRRPKMMVGEYWKHEVLENS